MTVEAASSGLPNAVAHTPIAGLTPGATYVFRASVFIPTGSPPVSPCLFDTMLTGAPVTQRDTWQQVALSFTAPANGTVTLGWVTDGTPADHTMVCYVDDASVRRSDVPDWFSGDTPDTAAFDFRWTGTAGSSATGVYAAGSPALLAGPVFQPSGMFMADWQVSATQGSAQVWVGLVSQDGSTILDRQGPFTLTTAQQVLHYEAAQGPNVPYRPALWVNGFGVDWALTTWSQAIPSDFDCVADYMRTFPSVSTVEGPLVTGQEVTACGDRLLYVSWTWVAGSPYRFGVPVNVLAGLTSSGQETSQKPGVIGTPMGVIAATPYNCPVPTQFASCVQDPCYAGFTAPPAGPVIPDPKRPNITTQQVHAASVYVPSDLIPNQEGVFGIVLGNDGSDKVGVRVRVYEDVPTTGTPSDLCDFAYEYLIDYIAPDAIFTIDGVAGGPTVLCPGDTVPQDASAVVRGSYGGPFGDPVARCDQSYYVIVMWLATYPWSCPASGANAGADYASGAPQGELTVAVNVAAREG